MQIATWNVNSVRQRTEHLLRYLRDVAPDVLCLQELKCVDDAFPREEVEALGYNVAIHGQKGFNGVAILAKTPIEVTRGLPGDPADEHARYIEAVLPHDGGVIRVASIYLPNGNPPDTDKYAYKLAWMDRLVAHARTLLALEEPLVLAGDYNVIPSRATARDPAAWIGDALFLPADASALSHAPEPWPDGRPARDHGRSRALHLLGLSGRRLAAQQGHLHRPPADVATGGRPARESDHRQGAAGRGQTVRSRSRST